MNPSPEQSAPDGKALDGSQAPVQMPSQRPTQPSPSARNPALGDLGLLPRELRDQIYSYVLDLQNAEHSTSRRRERREHPFPVRLGNGTGLLRASKQIYTEACPWLFRKNVFMFVIDVDPRSTIFSVSGQPSYEVRIFSSRLPHHHQLISPLPMALVREMRKVVFRNGEPWTEAQISPIRRIAGPERSGYQDVFTMAQKCIEYFKACDKLEFFIIGLTSFDEEPRSMMRILDLLLNVRNVQVLCVEVDGRHPTYGEQYWGVSAAYQVWI